MRKIKKNVVLLLTVLLLASMLAGCSSRQCVSCGKSFTGSGHDTGAGIVCDDCFQTLSGGTSAKNNNGVWIAITVMVFVAVFSATSGVVYLVLQKVLPPESNTSHRHRTQEYDYDDFQTPKPTPHRPVSNPAPRPSGTGGVWICPRDKNRNSGPYCAVCGAGRPAMAQRPQAARQAMREAPNPARPGGQGSGEAAVRPQRPAHTPRQQPSASVRQTPDSAIRQPSVRTDWDAAPVPEAPQKEYRGAFMRKERTQEPEVVPEEVPEVDSELLAAIFREAAESPEE